MTLSPELLALKAEIRYIRFSYELLDATNRHKGWIENVVDGWVRHDAEAEIKRIASVKLVGEPIDWLQDRIRPYMHIQLPDGTDHGWPLGTFLPTSPTRIYSDGRLSWEVACYDQTQILREERFGFNYTIKPDERITDYLRSLLLGANLTDFVIAPSDQVSTIYRHFPKGASRLDVIKDLADQINYAPLYFDPLGQAILRPYRNASERPATYTYSTDDESVTFGSFSETLDLYEVPNHWGLVVSHATEEPLYAEYTNTRMDSPTSVPRRGRRISRFATVEAVDQATLDALIERRAFEDSQAYGEVNFYTALMPFHSHEDVLDVNFFGSQVRYVESAWEMPLQVGAAMRHTAKRLVPV